MQITIADINIELDIIENTIINSSYLKKILESYGSRNRDKSAISITEVKDINFPNSMKKRTDYLYGEDAEFFYVDSIFFMLKSDINTGNSIFILKKDYESTFYLLKIIKIATSVSIIRGGGIPFHSSAISNNKNGYAFSGVSGSGKTTISNILANENRKILNDEFNIIMPAKNGYSIFSTPFTTEQKNDFCNNISAPLKKIYFLKKASKNRIDNQSIKKSYFQLLENIYTIPTSKKLADKILENALSICLHYSPEILYFVNNKTITKYWNAINNNEV